MRDNARDMLLPIAATVIQIQKRKLNLPKAFSIAS